MGKSFGNSLELKALATPATNPPSGSLLLYFKADGLLYKKDSAGVEAAVNTTGGGGAVPPGTIIPFAGVVTPANYLKCDGTAVSRTTYSTLWLAVSFQFTANNTSGTNSLTGITMARGALADVAAPMPISGPGIPAGTTVSAVNTGSAIITLSANTTAGSTGGTYTVAPYGLGDSSTTFDLPDTRIRGMIGEGGFGSGWALGAVDGRAAGASRAITWGHSHGHTASTSDPGITAGTPAGTIAAHASHTHSTPAHTHTMGNHTHSTPAHQHTVPNHSHSLNGHTHSNPAHFHSLNGHTHNAPGHNHNITFVGAVNTTASGGSSRVTVINGVSVTNTTQNAPTTGTDGSTSTGGAAPVNTPTDGSTTSLAASPTTTPTDGTTTTPVGEGGGTSGPPSNNTTNNGTGEGASTSGPESASLTHTFVGTALPTHSHTLTTTVTDGGSVQHPYILVAYLIKT